MQVCKSGKRLLSLFLSACLIVSMCVFPSWAASEVYTSIGNFWTWYAQSIWSAPTLDTVLGLTCDEVCLYSEDKLHHGTLMSNIPNRDYTFNAVCQYCGDTFPVYDADLAAEYYGLVDGFPDGLTSTSSGTSIYGTGIEFVPAENAELAYSYSRSRDLYNLANAAPVGSFYLVSGNYGSLSSVTQWYGFNKQHNTLLGVDVLVSSYRDDLFSYLSSNFPVGSFVDGATTTTSQAAFGHHSTVGWYGYPTMVCMNYSDALSVYQACKAGTVSLTGYYIFYLIPDSYYEPYYVTSSSRYCYGPKLYNLGRITLSSGSVDTVSGYGILYSSSSSKGYLTSYGLIPGDSYISDDDYVSIRLSALANSLNQYNLQHNIQDNDQNVNFVLVPVDLEPSQDTAVSPAIYDEEELVYTDPVTGTQYLTSGWTYDYLTRCYTLDMADDTFLIGETVIDTIKLTYGDELLTVEHYSGGSLIQTDEYNYVMMSGSECGLNGHSYTYENVKDPTCTTMGERKYTCSVCGDQYAENVPASGHTHVFSILKEATCTAAGIGVYTCSSCGSEYTETIPATDHVSTLLETVPSEFDENGVLISLGYSVYECSVCGTQYTVQDEISTDDGGWLSFISDLLKSFMIISLANLIVDHDPMTVAQRTQDTMRYVQTEWNKSHAEPIDVAELHKFLCDEHYGDLTEEQKEFVRLRRDEVRNAYGAMVCRLLLCEEMLRRNMAADFQTYRSVFCPDGGDAPWTLNRAG